MIFRFLSGSVTPARASKNRSDASTPVTGRPRCRKDREDVAALVLAEEARVDEDAAETLPHRLADQDGGDRRVDAARRGRRGRLRSVTMLADLRGRSDSRKLAIVQVGAQPQTS